MDNEKIELDTIFSMMMKKKEGVCKLKECPNCGTELKEAKDERYEMKGIGHSNLFAKRCPKCGFKAYTVLEHHEENST